MSMFIEGSSCAVLQRFSSKRSVQPVNTGTLHRRNNVRRAELKYTQIVVVVVGSHKWIYHAALLRTTTVMRLFSSGLGEMIIGLWHTLGTLESHPESEASAKLIDQYVYRV